MSHRGPVLDHLDLAKARHTTNVATSAHDRMLSLHRYFLAASTMKAAYERRAAEYGIALNPDHFDWNQQWVYLSLWYATLFVVAEEWVSDQTLRDDEVDALLKTENLDLLRRFRNGVFHFQSRYYDPRLTDFVAAGAGSAAWIRQLHSSLGRSILARLSQSQANLGKPTRLG